MKISWEVVLSVLVALLVWKILDKLFIDNALNQILPNSFDDYDDLDDLDDLDNFLGQAKKKGLRIEHRSNKPAANLKHNNRAHLVKKAHELGEHLEHFDDFDNDDFEVSDFEAEDMWDEYEDHVQKYTSRKGALQGRKLADTHMKNKYGSTKWNKAKSKGKSGKSGNLVGVGGKYQQYNAFVGLVITRLTNNIAGISLPFIVFAANQSASSFVDIMKQYLPAGVTYTATIEAATGDLLLTYTQGANTDIVRIHCNQTAYATFLSALITDQFDVKFMRYTLADPTQLSQFSQEFQYGKKTLFGKFASEDFPIEMFKDPKQYQNGIIDVKLPYDVDKERFLAGFVIPAAAGCSFTLNLFISNYFKYTAKAVLNS